MRRADALDIVILGLSITSSWGNGHATTYRGLVRELERRGHRVLFLERDVPWYANNRDLPNPPFGRTELYTDLADLRDRFSDAIADADFVVVGSYVPDGIDVGDWVLRRARGAVAFYDIDTPVTLATLARGDNTYLTPSLIARYHLYLSFTGGPTLDRLERELGAARARPLYCAVDPDIYFPEPPPPGAPSWDLGYMGTYSADRQPTVDRLLLEPARALPERRFSVVGPMYPDSIVWPPNVERTTHLPPSEHRAFYNAQRYTLNVTRRDMIAAGYSPSVRLFEAAACGTPIISDEWPGIETLLTPGRELLIARTADDTVAYLRDIPEAERRAIGERARRRVLDEHTAAHRAAELEAYALEVIGRPGATENAAIESGGRAPTAATLR